MELNNIKLSISDKTKLTDYEKNSLLESYRVLFTKMYGYDIIYDYLKSNSKKNNNYYTDFLDDDLSILLIYQNDNNLIGGGRIKIIDNKIIKVVDIAINMSLESDKRDLWKIVISYIENYYRNLNYQKMYIEIPFNEPCLLIRANDLGFIESPEDISILGNNKTYILNKILESKKDE